MNAFTIAIALAALIDSAPQDPTLENKAIIRVQQAPASQYDPALSGRPFGNWFNQIVGPQSGVNWHLTECIEKAGGGPDGEQDIPACVEATAILPNDRKVVVQIFVGSFKQGLSAKTKFHFAVIEDGDQLRNVGRLGELPQLLRAEFPKTRLKTITLPRIRATASPRLYIARALALPDLPKAAPFGTEAEIPPPPPKRASPLRVSKGVTTGDAITRVTPVYPTIARQVNASGEVQVAIMIDETGRVIEAKATSGHPMLRSAAEDAARKWVFQPSLLDGKPVKQQGVLTFIFNPAQ